MSMEHITEEEKLILLRTFPLGIIALDFETTGLSPLIDKIIEIGAIKITPNKTEIFTSLINPEIDIPKTTTKIHGITNEMVADSKKIEEIFPEFMKFIEDMPIIAHNAKFDIGFILFNCYQLDHPANKSKVYCSVQFARNAFPKMDSYKLQNISKELEIPLESHHRAKDDAIACLRIFAKGLLKTKSEKSSFLFKTDDFSKNRMFRIPNHLQLIRQKLEKQEPMEIKYQGGSHRNIFRPVRPISIYPMPNGNFLYAHCLLSDIYKSFNLNKIVATREITTGPNNNTE